MDREKIKELLENVKAGKIEIAEALRILKALPYEDLGFAKIDTHRDLRRGFPEVILCQGKSIEQITKIIEKLSSGNEFIMATRVNKQVYEAIKNMRADAVYHEAAGIVLIGKRKGKATKKTILVVSAGTADLPVAEEAAVTAVSAEKSSSMLQVSFPTRRTR